VPKIWSVSSGSTQNYKYLHNLNKILKLRVYLNKIIWNDITIRAASSSNENKMKLCLLFEVKFICKFMQRKFSE